MDFTISIADDDKAKLIHLIQKNFNHVIFTDGKYSVSDFKQNHRGSKAYVSDKTIYEVMLYQQKHGSGQTAKWLGLGIRTFQRAVASYKENNQWRLNEYSRTTLFRTGTDKNIYAIESKDSNKPDVFFRENPRVPHKKSKTSS